MPRPGYPPIASTGSSRSLRLKGEAAPQEISRRTEANVTTGRRREAAVVGTDPSRPARSTTNFWTPRGSKMRSAWRRPPVQTISSSTTFRRRVTHDDLTDQCAEDDWQTHRTNIID